MPCPYAEANTLPTGSYRAPGPAGWFDTLPPTASGAPGCEPSAMPTHGRWPATTRNKAAPATGGWKSSSNRLQRPRARTTLKLHMSFRTLTFMLAGLAMLGPFATDAYLPSFHSIGSEFEVSQAMVQQTLSLYLTCFALMSLFY